MAIEIEKKFLVDDTCSELKDFIDNAKEIYIKQNYLVSNDGEELRVRKKVKDEQVKYELTFKKETDDSDIREETENEITLPTYLELIEKCDRKPIKKKRYLKEKDGFFIIVDIFKNYKDENILTLAEVEFQNTDVLNDFKKPNFLVKEVTNQPNYRNKNIWLDLYI